MDACFNWLQVAAAARDEWTDFGRRLIQTPSPSGDERRCAELIVEEMKRLRYDEAFVDGAGNAVGIIRGTQAGAAPIMLNSHADHVDPGDHDAWPHPPYAGVIENGTLFGRGASDTKGAIAVQVYAPALLLRAGRRPLRDTVVAAVVLEETGGLGTRWLVERDGLPRFGFALLGEATANEICIGHRGRAELYARFQGRAVHASVPEKGLNPYYGAARFLSALEQSAAEKMAIHPVLGRSTLTPTTIGSSSTSRNAIPDWAEVILDWRYTSETPEQMTAILQELIDRSGGGGTAGFCLRDTVSYTGLSDRSRHIAFAYALQRENPLVESVRKTVAAVLGRPVEVGTWRFCTDGGYLVSEAGIPTIGFSPCEERYAHTVHDQVSLGLMEEAVAVYMALLAEDLFD